MSTSPDDQVTNPRALEPGCSLSDICERRFSRRDLIKSGLVIGAATIAGGISACTGEVPDKPISTVPGEALAGAPQSNFDFVEIRHGIDQHHHVAPDHEVQILLRWGDPIFDHAEEFDPHNQTAEKQLQQFGYNNDYIGYVDLPPQQGQQARALLCVNHEYPQHGLMFADFGADAKASLSAAQVAISQAAVGASVLEIGLQDGQWQLNRSSKYNRRISALDTPIEISGPLAEHARLRTSSDPQAKTVIGTFNNCAGGITPWGTYLSCEENFNFHFSGILSDDHPEAENYQRYNLPFDLFHWGKHDKRFDINAEPNEANRFGWVVEIDPMNPASTPKKRTALGRFKHEGGENVIAADGRLVIYMGDDQRFEYLYKFVSRDQVDLLDRQANRDLLDHGILYVARFLEDGRLEWLPLVHDNQKLQTQFASLAEILLEPRRAADLLGATPMDRPEDVVPNAATGKVYVMLTNNTIRNQVNAANPRPKNQFGHIVEISETDGDFAGTGGSWDILCRCGDPEIPDHKADWNPQTSENGWFASPDNGVIDPAGRLWVATDQGPATVLSGTADGLWAMETAGPLRGTGKMFFRVPAGAELCGPVFSDDGENLFLAVQHPGAAAQPGGVRIKTASTLWPDFEAGMPPRPSILVVRKKAGGRIG